MLMTAPELSTDSIGAAIIPICFTDLIIEPPREIHGVIFTSVDFAGIFWEKVSLGEVLCYNEAEPLCI